MNMEEACNLALERLGLDEIPPYSSSNPAVVRKRIEYTSMVGLILREERAKNERAITPTKKLDDFIEVTK